MLDNADNFLDFFSASSAMSDTAEDGLATFIPHCSRGTVLVTTRDERVALSLCGNQTILKEAMDQDDAVSLFHSICPTGRATDSDAQALKSLLRELSHLPLAIAHVASYLRQNRLVTLNKYLERFQSTKAERVKLLSKPFVGIRRSEDPRNLETVLTTFTISFQQIEEQSPLAGSLIRVMACVNRQSIPVELFKSLDDTETVEEALSRLTSFSLLAISSEGSAVEIHALIQLSAQQFLSSRDELRRATETTAALLVQILPCTLRVDEIHPERFVCVSTSTILFSILI